MKKRYTFFVLYSVLCLALSMTVGCVPGPSVSQDLQASLEQKAETAMELIQKRAEAGEDVSDVVATMEAAGRRFENGDAAGGEALLDQALAQLQTGKSLQPLHAASEPATDLYGNPQLVTVQGYDASKGIMEPFITRDGKVSPV